jgi:hypothetical protein
MPMTVLEDAALPLDVAAVRHSRSAEIVEPPSNDIVPMLRACVTP